MATNCDDVEPCDGPNRCHGCASWCDQCGDVGNVCHDADRKCSQHFCPQCEKGPTLIRDYACEGCRQQRDAERAEFYMLTSRDEKSRQRWAERFAGFIGRSTP